jgi:hypothetical protein
MICGKVLWDNALESFLELNVSSSKAASAVVHDTILQHWCQQVCIIFDSGSGLSTIGTACQSHPLNERSDASDEGLKVSVQRLWLWCKGGAVALIQCAAL